MNRILAKNMSPLIYDLEFWGGDDDFKPKQHTAADLEHLLRVDELDDEQREEEAEQPGTHVFLGFMSDPVPLDDTGEPIMDSTVEERWGWCFLDGHGLVEADGTGWVFWGLRQVVKRPSTAAVKAHLELRVRHWEEQENTLIDGETKAQLREQVWKDLVRRTPPTPKDLVVGYDMIGHRLMLFQSDRANIVTVARLHRVLDHLYDGAEWVHKRQGLEDYLNVTRQYSALPGDIRTKWLHYLATSTWEQKILVGPFGNYEVAVDGDLNLVGSVTNGKIVLSRLAMTEPVPTLGETDPDDDGSAGEDAALATLGEEVKLMLAQHRLRWRHIDLFAKDHSNGPRPWSFSVRLTSAGTIAKLGDLGDAGKPTSPSAWADAIARRVMQIEAAHGFVRQLWRIFDFEEIGRWLHETPSLFPTDPEGEVEWSDYLPTGGTPIEEAIAKAGGSAEGLLERLDLLKRWHLRASWVRDMVNDDEAYTEAIRPWVGVFKLSKPGRLLGDVLGQARACSRRSNDRGVSPFVTNQDLCLCAGLYVLTDGDDELLEAVAAVELPKPDAIAVEDEADHLLEIMPLDAEVTPAGLFGHPLCGLSSKDKVSRALVQLEQRGVVVKPKRGVYVRVTE